MHWPDRLPQFVRQASAFQRPEVLAALMEDLRAGIPRNQLLANPALKPVREAWHAVMFGLGLETAYEKPMEIRICEPEPFPDFQLNFMGEIKDFEVTTATATKLTEQYKGDTTLGPRK